MLVSFRRRAPMAAAAALLPLLASAAALAQSPSLPLSVTQATAPAPTAPTAQISVDIAARVNDDIISTYDLRQRMLLLIITSGVQPTKENIPQLEQEAMRSLVDQHLENQEIKRIAKKSKSSDLVASDKDVDDEIADIAKQNNINYAQMKRNFADSGLDIQTLREQIRTSITWQTLVGGIYGHNIRVGDDQISQQLKRLSNQASQTQYLVGEIFIEANRAGGIQQATDAANQLLAQLQQGAPFPNVARQFSGAPTAANGGDVGWISAPQVQPEVAKALEQMRPGQLSSPIPVSDGVYVVALRDKKAASSQTMVALKQAAVRLAKDAPADQVSAAAATLTALKPQLHGCDNIDQASANAKDVITADLGEADINDLGKAFKDAAEKLQAGQVSDPIRTDVGLHLIAVCSKHSGASSLPTRAEISNRLQAEQLAVMSRRYLRDLRTSATIDTR